MDPDGPPPLVRAALDGAGPPGGLAAWCCATGLVAVGGAPTAGGVEVALLDPQRPQVGDGVGRGSDDGPGTASDGRMGNRGAFPADGRRPAIPFPL